ncbi:HPr family phosphocarrier protein [Romboutsia lituseburensis]|uniref:HPr family phosphocarrier protein n=1 Tax=Romboutsia lituseburensis TaxID=1537 RepID=UPI00215A9FA5|nr:HPr family phosphocarrier protein [Romboutsia lituseburensis]MCR8743992.1 HPr family phosphocarrier protein [Romboutsia lituseburensis]
MVKQEVTIVNESGLHARPATMLIRKASKYKSNITIIKGSAQVSAKSILGLFSLGVCKGETIIIQAEGEDEQLAVNELAKYISELNE